MTIADWSAIATIYNNNTASQLKSDYLSHMATYSSAHSGSTVSSQSEYALMKIFGNAINFYKKDPTTGKYEPYGVDANGNIQKTTCP